MIGIIQQTTNKNVEAKNGSKTDGKTDAKIQQNGV
jgi:hypothetical protein